LGAYHRVEPILEKTGMVADMPPESIHAMARAPHATGGDPWLADLVIDALARVGQQIQSGGAVLDFGCSSGRILRVLSAWRPDVRWLGCDPNADAVEWAAEHLPGVEVFRSPQHPPLALDDASLDAVYAISIWSHFGECAAQAWLREMYRLLRPGGVLLLTTHGFAAVSHFLRNGGLARNDALACARALIARGHWFQDAFGPDGDWGVADPEWGMAYMTPEWLLSRVLPDWTALLYEPGRLGANQDVFVLERRPVAGTTG
jgi:SAM-dependent methyltransferase